jgi:hypothetical protein
MIAKPDPWTCASSTARLDLPGLRERQLMLILDTDALPVADRIDAVRLAMGSPVAPSSVDVDTGVRARILARALGPSAALVHMESSGLRMTRTARHVRGSAEEKVSVAIQLAGRARLTHRGLGPLGAGELHLVDLTSPFDYETGSDSDAQAVYIDTAVLGVTVDAVRAAAGRLRGSPLYSLTRPISSASARSPTPSRTIASQRCWGPRPSSSSARSSSRRPRSATTGPATPNT